jgi:Ni,Fe-hydrogenase III large subunit/Ni,Fe-hydrogenase III component G
MQTNRGVFKRKVVLPAELSPTARKWLTGPGRRFGHLTARRLDGRHLAIDVLLLDTSTGGGLILSAALPDDGPHYPALTPAIPAAHWAERAAGDFFGVEAIGHPRWETLILHTDTWQEHTAPLALQRSVPRKPYAFVEVAGEGVHEIPVGPIHAGIIEPGHFRFSCVGEIISNLEIRLGYQHRGIELRLSELPWTQTRFTAESASTDTAVGNALAHAVALEQLLQVEPPARAQMLRSIALELERLANHLGDLGGLSADIGYSPGAAQFPLLRAKVLALGELLTGTRLQRYYIKPGGVLRDLDEQSQVQFAGELVKLRRHVQELLPLVFDNPAVLERFDGVGRLRASLAQDFGMVGPAARASGSSYDARQAFPHGVYPAYAPMPTRREAGDVLARAQVRAAEIHTSLAVISVLLDELAAGPIQTDDDRTELAPDSCGVGLVEAWRGELIHWVTTDKTGNISRYAIKDPSFNNWTGLAIAVRGNLVADFPVCNKSFSLSYSGNDL